MECCVRSFICLCSLPPNALTPGARYDEISKMFGGLGFNVNTHSELEEAMKKAIAFTEGPSVINVNIDGMAQRKPQVCDNFDKFDFFFIYSDKMFLI